MIVFCTATCVEAVQRRPDERDDGDQIARELNLDMADWWTPSTDAYLNYVPKQKLIDMVTEIKSADIAAPMAKMNRNEALAFAAEHGKDSRWLPKVLRRAACQRGRAENPPSAGSLCLVQWRFVQAGRERPAGQAHQGKFPSPLGWTPFTVQGLAMHRTGPLCDRGFIQRFPWETGRPSVG